MMAILSCKIMARHINQRSLRVVRIQWTFTPRYDTINSSGINVIENDRRDVKVELRKMKGPIT